RRERTAWPEARSRPRRRGSRSRCGPSHRPLRSRRLPREQRFRAAFDRHHVIADRAHRSITAAVEPAAQRPENADHGTGKKPEKHQGDAPRPRGGSHLPRMYEIAEPLRVIGKEAEKALIAL